MAEEKSRVVLQERSVLEKYDGEVGSGEEVLRERVTATYDHETDIGELKTEFFDKSGKPQPSKTKVESGQMNLKRGEQ